MCKQEIIIKPTFWLILKPFILIYNLLINFTNFTQQIPSEILPESVVSNPINDWTDGSGQDLHNNVGSKQGVGVILGEPDLQSVFELRRRIWSHAEEQLEAMKDYCVSGFLGVFVGFFCSEEDLQVGVEDYEPNWS